MIVRSSLGAGVVLLVRCVGRSSGFVNGGAGSGLFSLVRVVRAHGLTDWGSVVEVFGVGSVRRPEIIGIRRVVDVGAVTLGVVARFPARSVNVVVAVTAHSGSRHVVGRLAAGRRACSSRCEVVGAGEGVTVAVSDFAHVCLLLRGQVSGVDGTGLAILPPQVDGASEDHQHHETGDTNGDGCDGFIAKASFVAIGGPLGQSQGRHCIKNWFCCEKE